MSTLATTINTISPNETFTHMFHTTLTTSWSPFWWINIYLLLRFRIKKSIIEILGEIIRNLILKPLLELWLFLNIKPILRGTTFKIPCLLSFPIRLPRTTILNLLIMNHQPRKIHIIMMHGCMTLLFKLFARYKMANLIPIIRNQRGSIFGLFNEFQRVILDIHTSFTNVDKLIYLSFSFLPLEESVKKCLFEDLPSHGNTS